MGSRAITGVAARVALLTDNILQKTIVVVPDSRAHAPTLSTHGPFGLLVVIVTEGAATKNLTGQAVIAAGLTDIIRGVKVVPLGADTLQSPKIHNLELLDFAPITVQIVQFLDAAVPSRALLHAESVIEDDWALLAVAADSLLFELEGDEAEP